MNAVLLNVLFRKQSWKKYHGYHKNIKQLNFNIDEINILEGLLISCDTDAWSNYIKL